MHFCINSTLQRNLTVLLLEVTEFELCLSVQYYDILKKTGTAYTLIPEVCCTSHMFCSELGSMMIA